MSVLLAPYVFRNIPQNVSRPKLLTDDTQTSPEISEITCSVCWGHIRITSTEVTKEGGCQYCGLQ